MSTYSHILVGLDLSDECDAILSKSAALASVCDAELSVAHVFEPLTFAFGGDLPIDLSEAQKVMEDKVKKRLYQIASPLNIPEKNQIIRIGLTADELHAVALELKADLIIVGSHGRHGLAALFGNTANGVIRGAQCDVLAIRV